MNNAIQCFKNSDLNVIYLTKKGFKLSFKIKLEELNATLDLKTIAFENISSLKLSFKVTNINVFNFHNLPDHYYNMYPFLEQYKRSELSLFTLGDQHQKGIVVCDFISLRISEENAFEVIKTNKSGIVVNYNIDNAMYIERPPLTPYQSN